VVLHDVAEEKEVERAPRRRVGARGEELAHVGDAAHQARHVLVPPRLPRRVEPWSV